MTQTYLTEAYIAKPAALAHALLASFNSRFAIIY